MVGAGHSRNPKAVIHVIRTFTTQLIDGTLLENLQWVPSHLMHDCENDDMLAWLLLLYIHKKRGTTLRKRMQLPMEAIRDEDGHKVTAILCAKKITPPVNLESDIFYDEDATNWDAIKLHHLSGDSM